MSKLEVNHIKDTLDKWKINVKKYTLDEHEIDIKIGEFIWFEAKQKNEDIYKMFAQLIFTVKRIYQITNLPIYFACFNKLNGSIIENYQVQKVLKHTDINWKLTPSSIDKKHIDRIKILLGNVPFLTLEELGKEVNQIIKEKKLSKKYITKNNFLSIYSDWLKEIGNFIQIDFLDSSIGIEDCYLADLMTDGKKSIAEKLKVILKIDKSDDAIRYYYKNKIEERKKLFQEIEIKEQEKYRRFWLKYERPPKEEYQEFILSRRDLLQTEEIREIKGAFFTPKIWSDKSKEYLEKALGENWQDEYYIWDPACGTGNLEQGLLNQDRVFISTLDQSDLDIIKEIKLMPNAVRFQFDFLNDDFKSVDEGGKLPNSLYKIIKNTPHKLIIYMNPPYAEVGDKREKQGIATKKIGKIKNKAIVQEMNKLNLGKSSNELFVQFYYQVYKEIKGCIIASFSKLKNFTGANFENFRNFFKAETKRGFMCPSFTFDNVKGKFPISFQIWNTSIEYDFPKEIIFDVLNEDGILIKEKSLFSIGKEELINSWLVTNNKVSANHILFYIKKDSNDFQNSLSISLYSKKPLGHTLFTVTKDNLIDTMVYVAVRLCIDANWVNDRDQFGYPYEKEVQNNTSLSLKSEFTSPKYLYEDDLEFINNCIVFSLFKKNVTNFQLFRNSDIGLDGTERDKTITELLLDNRNFSNQANLVLSLAKDVYKLYYKDYDNLKASWKEINTALRESKNITYLELRVNMIKAMKSLANKVALKLHEYGFLRY